MLLCSVQIISLLESQSKFQMLTLFSGRHIGVWLFHTRLCKFLRNISTNIWSLGKRTDVKLGEVSSFFISYNITIFWLYLLDGFQCIVLLRNSENDLLGSSSRETGSFWDFWGTDTSWHILQKKKKTIISARFPGRLSRYFPLYPEIVCPICIIIRI